MLVQPGLPLNGAVRALNGDVTPPDEITLGRSGLDLLIHQLKGTSSITVHYCTCLARYDIFPFSFQR